MISKELGEQYVDFRSFKIDLLYSNTDNKTPIIFIIQSGAEPLSMIEKLTDILGKGRIIDVVSLG